MTTGFDEARAIEGMASMERAIVARGCQFMYGKLGGSWSHSAGLPESDYDFLSVYVVETPRILGLDPYPETIDGKAPDFEAHEVGKFCRLLVKGNPAMIETLFTERHQKMLFDIYAWRDLVEHRRDFLTQRAVAQYVGYAKGQLSRLQSHRPLHTAGGAYNTKWAYHIVRLMQDARRIAGGGEPQVWREAGPELDFIMKVRTGGVDQDVIASWLEEMIAAVDSSVKKLPAEPPRGWLNDWLLGVRGVAGK